MIVTTTDRIEGTPVTEVLGIVAGETVVGVNIFRDLFASIRDIVGGRAGGYQNALKDAREIAIREMAEEAQALGADAVVAVDIDYEAIGQNGSMLMVSCNGTAVRLKR